MPDAANKPCPECGSLQTSSGPFCDNCGFRLGRMETEQEGHRAIKRTHAPSDYSDTAIEHSAAPRMRISSQHETAVEGVEAVVVQGLPEQTEVEGVSSVKAISANLPTERHAPIQPPSKAEPLLVSLPTERNPPVRPKLNDVPTSTDLPVLVDDEPPMAELETRQTARWMWAMAWLASLVAVATVTEYYARGAAINALEEEMVPSPVRATRIAVPAGTFKRGLNERVRATILSTCLKMSDDKSLCDETTLLAGEYPDSEEKLPGFAIDALEVSVGDYQRCADASECEAIDWKTCKVYTLQGLQVSLRTPRTLQLSAAAATCVSKAQAAAYCEWHSGRLPTHDEWERAARGTDGRVYPWGSIWDPEGANWGELDVVRMPVPGKIDGFDWVAPPGSFPDGLSPIGAMDMAGNVAEWVSDEPVAARGGSWTSTPFDLRVTSRLELAETARRTDVGFRCAY